MRHFNRWMLLSLMVAMPLAAQTLNGVKPITPNINAIQVDWKQQFEKEREKNRKLREENGQLQSQLAEWTRKGGSLVHAYCETRTISANSAGARYDCSVSGYTCEPVSGVCRTSARSSDECATGFLLDVDHCVPRPR
jgi:hypothetical protein